MQAPLEIIILAAGQGTRMRSQRPKVLHTLAGRSLLAHVLATARALEPSAIHVVYGHGGEAVPSAFPDAGVNWVLQGRQLGTGHAVDQAIGAVHDGAQVLVLYGDVPLVTRDTLLPLLAAAASGVGLLTVSLADPRGYGRIIRDESGAVRAIVEHKDATPEQLAIREGNTGILVAPASKLRAWLTVLDNDNAQAEYYLTDVIAMAVAEGRTVAGVPAHDPEEVLGVNDRRQLAQLERAFQRRQANALLDAGATLADPARFDLRGSVAVGQDVFIDVGVVCEGRVVLGDGVRIGANCVLCDVEIGAGTEVLPMSVVESARIGADCAIGPYARIRPGTEVEQGARVGNFVEVKNSRIGVGSKVSHLSYIGDTDMGADVNIGAGTITCNYDGANKYRTVIGDRAFIGSDTQLVAPVRIGDGATIGAGSTITKDAPDDELTLSRNKQQTFPGWQRPVKNK